MNHLIRRNSAKPRRRLPELLARLLLTAAAIAFVLGCAIALVLLVATWKFLALPYRRLTPHERRQSRAGAAAGLLAAVAAGAAAFRREAS